jgi:DNA mismatch repair protein MutL
MRGATGPVEAQRLVIPTTAHLGHREAVVLEANLEELGRFGFEVEPFGSDSFIVRAVPALLGRVDAQSLLTDLAEELAGESGGVERRRERILITTACRSAIKAGDALAPIERDRLVAQLMMTEKPYLCPHGRAIIVAISAAEIDLKFHR